MNIDIIQPRSRLHIPDSSRVTAVRYSGQKLFVGFSNGDLAVYSTSDVPQALDHHLVRSVRSLRSFSDIKGLFDNDRNHLFVLDTIFRNVFQNQRPIDCISPVPIANDAHKTVLAVGNAETLSVFEHVGSHLNLVSTFEEPRPYAAFEYVVNGDAKLFVIGAKKKLYIYRVVHKSRNIFTFALVKEIALKDKVKTITSLIPNGRSQLLVGLAHDFFLVDLDHDLHMFPLPVDEIAIYNFNHSTSFGYFGLSNGGPETRVVYLAHDRLLLTKDTQAIVLSFAGGSVAIESSPVALLVVPLHIAYISPSYLLLVFSKKVEIVDFETGDLIQKFYHQIGSNSICLTVEDNSIVVGSGSDILHFNVLGYQRQVAQYLSIRGAEFSSKSVKDPKNDLRLIGLQKAISLVSKLSSDDDYFENKDSSREKKKQLVLRDLYKQMAVILFESYSRFHEALVEISSDWMISFSDVLALFPDFLHGDSQINQAIDKDQPDTASIKSNSNNAVRRVSLADVEAEKFTGTTDSGTETEAPQAASGRSNRPSSSLQKLQFGQLYAKSQNMRKFTKAVNNLIIYLTDQRRIHLTFLNAPENGPVPKVEWKGTSVSPFDLYPWLKQSNLRTQLNNIATIIDTSLFLCYFHTKPMLLGPLLRLPNNRCNAKVVNDSLLRNLHVHDGSTNQQTFIKELLDFYFGRKLHKDALQMLHKLAHEKGILDHGDEFDDFLGKPDLTIQYLQKLTNNDLELIFHFAHWVISEANGSQLEKSALIFMNDSYECESYDNFKVLDFFINVIRSDVIAVRYLEWILFESDVLENLKRKNSLLKFHTRLCLLYLKTLKELDVEDEEFFHSESYVKLYSLLQTTNHYEPWTVLKNIPTTVDRFLRLTIFIYKRLGEHDKSIDVLFNQLNDLDAAMEYCSDIYQQPNSRESGEKLLHKLLEDLLMHPEENVTSIEKLLNQQGSKMSILRVLTSLPNSFPLTKLAAYLAESLRKSEQQLHDGQLASQLYKVGLIKVQEKLLSTQAEAYPIQSGRQVCPICSKRLGYSVMSVDKNNHVVHYGCFQRSRSQIAEY